MRKYWLGMLVLVSFLLSVAWLIPGSQFHQGWISVVFLLTLGAWVVRGFFRFIGRAIGHGYRQSAK